MNNKPLVSVLLINLNGRAYLDKCLGTLFKSSYKNIEVIIVDNGSSDGSVEYIKRRFPIINVISLTKNIGYARAHDMAFQKSKGEAILFLNTDTEIGKHTISSLVEFLFSNSKIGCVQPTIVLASNKRLIDSVGSYFIKNGDLYHIGREKNVLNYLYKNPFTLFSVKNVATLAKREVILKTGIFDPDYFAYFEETDFCMKVWLAGYSVWYYPTDPVIHIGGGGANQLSSSFVLFHSEKNRITTYIKNLSMPVLLNTLIRLLFWYLVAILYACIGRFSDSLAIIKSILWNITHLNKILIKRNHVQSKIRKIKDENYLPQVTRNVSLKYYYYQFFGGIDRYENKTYNSILLSK